MSFSSLYNLLSILSYAAVPTIVHSFISEAFTDFQGLKIILEAVAKPTVMIEYTHFETWCVLAFEISPPADTSWESKVLLNQTVDSELPQL